MKKARELFANGQLDEAIQALGAELRDHPGDLPCRTFLFELLCFTGNWDRADKQLDILAGADKDRRMGALLYRGAINAERTRQEKLEKAEDAPEAIPVTGSLNDRPFQAIEDADPRVGGRLEVIAGSDYMWVPWEHVASIAMEPPKRLRDLLWAPANVQTGPAFSGADLGNVLLPVLSPFSWRHADSQVKLGRLTIWEEGLPLGQKMLLVDGEEFPLLELRKLEIAHPEAATA